MPSTSIFVEQDVVSVSLFCTVLLLITLSAIGVYAAVLAGWLENPKHTF